MKTRGRVPWISFPGPAAVKNPLHEARDFIGVLMRLLCHMKDLFGFVHCFWLKQKECLKAEFTHEASFVAPQFKSMGDGAFSVHGPVQGVCNA